MADPTPTADAERDTFPLRQNRSDLWRLVVQKDRANDELRSDITTLTADRDAAEALTKVWNARAARAEERCEALQADRDAALAEVKRLREEKHRYKAALYSIGYGLTDKGGPLSSDRARELARAALAGTSETQADVMKRREDWLIPIAPDARKGKLPCGECRIRPGETCDVCGASETQAAGDGA